MLNLYNFYSEPESLANYEQAKTQVPLVAWDLANTDEQKRALGHLWAQDPKLAYDYASTVLHGRFLAGEPAIARNSAWAYYYAWNVLEKPWPPGSKAIETIARDTYYSDEYAREVLELSGEDAKKWGAGYLEQHGLEPHQPND